MTTHSTTQTGIPITTCDTCGRAHPITRRHCEVCGIPSIFVALDGRCLRHTKDVAS